MRVTVSNTVHIFQEHAFPSHLYQISLLHFTKPWYKMIIKLTVIVVYCFAIYKTIITVVCRNAIIAAKYVLYGFES